jgi:DNA-directed RNA polymerase subunit RPC12/RpoP
MKIQIGRESGAVAPRLCLNYNNHKLYIGDQGSVPKTVSRCHCLLDIRKDNEIIISNVSDNNTIFINGLEYKEKVLLFNDIIELGQEKYRLDMPAILNAIREDDKSFGRTYLDVYDVSYLKDVWNKYAKTKLDIQIKERKINAMSAVPGVISMISIALSFIDGLRAVFITVAAMFALVFVLIRVNSAEKTPIKQKELDEKFQDEYVCPRCKHYLGNQRYEVLLRNGSCPWCGSKFKDKLLN